MAGFCHVCDLCDLTPTRVAHTWRGLPCVRPVRPDANPGGAYMAGFAMHATCATRRQPGWRIHGGFCHVCDLCDLTPTGVAHTWRVLPCMRPVRPDANRRGAPCCKMPSVPKQRHFYGLNHLHYLTTSTYRRARLFDSERFKRHFVTSWQDLRAELSFRIIGYVLMPEHFHILLWPSDLANPSQIMQKLEDRTAKFILKNLRHSREFGWCESMLNRLELPPTIHHHAHYLCGSGDSTTSSPTCQGTNSSPP
jgi:REP element-mobilizing transposase RayT